MKKLLKKDCPKYNCPFCKNEIVSSRKTEVFYRNHWIDGCFDCFALSINDLTKSSFQTTNY